MTAWGVVEGLIGLELIRIVATGFGRTVQRLLEIIRGSFPEHIPADNTVSRAVNIRYDVDFVFLSPTKLYNSSSSLTFSCPLGCGGASGSTSALAFTQLATV